MDKSILKGVIDTHIHTAPDAFRRRKFNDLELADEAERCGARAIVIKSHSLETAARAQLVDSLHRNLRVFGGLALNIWCGGLNPFAVEAALDVGAKVVWLPTLTSRLEMDSGIICAEAGVVKEPLVDILKIMAQTDAVLATGHISFDEQLAVVDKARELGVKKIVVNHPELYRTRLNLRQQERLLEYGVIIERTYGGTQLPRSREFMKHLPMALEAIKALGAGSTIIATDVGQPTNVGWSDAYAEYMEYLEQGGISREEIDLMTKVLPARLLGLEPEAQG